MKIGIFTFKVSKNKLEVFKDVKGQKILLFSHSWGIDKS